MSTVNPEVANKVSFMQLQLLSRAQAGRKPVKSATDYGQFKIDYTLGRRTRGKGL